MFTRSVRASIEASLVTPWHRPPLHRARTTFVRIQVHVGCGTLGVGVGSGEPVGVGDAPDAVGLAVGVAGTLPVVDGVGDADPLGSGVAVVVASSPLPPPEQAATAVDPRITRTRTAARQRTAVL